MEKYLLEVNADEILIENRDNGNLKISLQQKLIKHLVDFIILNFGPLPIRKEKEIVARAACELFAYLKKKDSPDDGTVFINYSKLNSM